jgi:hypothetical protein
MELTQGESSVRQREGGSMLTAQCDAKLLAPEIAAPSTSLTRRDVSSNPLLDRGGNGVQLLREAVREGEMDLCCIILLIAGD